MVLDAEEQLDASFRNTGQRYCLIPQTCHGLNEAKSREASVVSFVLELELAVVSRPLENAEESRGERLLEAWRIPRDSGLHFQGTSGTSGTSATSGTSGTRFTVSGVQWA